MSVGDVSNYDFEIADDLEGKIEYQGYEAKHTAWNFLGKITFIDGQFQMEVWQYGSIKNIIQADTLRELCIQANNLYGWD